MRIPDAKIDEIRAASDIVDVIAASIPLRKRGKSYVGLCPFHQEKTPSFTVSPEKQMYHCFGCGAGGNVFTFVMETEKVSFVEAVRVLAERTGITLPTGTEEESAQATENEALYSACRTAGRFFHENLVGSSEGKLALEYLHHRGFTDETIRRFGLGYSLNSWDGLVRLAGQQRLDLPSLERAGLIIRREDGSGYYDRFRGRTMFPIFSPSGRLLAFGARKLHEDDPLAKYINSPETPIYNKSRVLYGLSHAKEAIRSQEYALLVEGYADLLSLFQAGIENVVASSGTALTEEQIQLVGRYAKTITLVYDADSAGSKATLRGVDLILENGFDVRVAQLPAGEDPDSFVRAKGATGFQRLLDGAVSFLDFKARMFLEQGLLATPEGKTHAVRSIVGTIARMPDELKRNFYVKSVAERYDIYESVLFRELEQQVARERNRPRIEREGKMVPRGPESISPPSAGKEPAGPLPAADRDLLKVMLEHGPPMVNEVLSVLDPALLTHPLAQRILGLLRGHGSTWDVHTILRDAQDEELRRAIADLVFSRHEISKGWAGIGSPPSAADPYELAEQAVKAIQLREIDRLLSEQFRLMKAAESRGEPVRPYQEQVLRLQQERKELQHAKILSRVPR